MNFAVCNHTCVGVLIVDAPGRYLFIKDAEYPHTWTSVAGHGATKYKLYDKIEGLRGQLDEDLIVDLHEARMLGNDSVHDGLPYSPEEVANVAELIVEMTQTPYIEPAKKAAMREARKQCREAHKNGESPVSS
ncbi:hypothetical protein [Streptosporangium sp. V21-05]|uniref:hypothetical protein n=1 Tax=Streptosporangium sp. V21-05 TaxID=3446115 RepID=UPI003F53B4AA